MFPHFYELYLQEPYEGLTVNTLEKNPLMFLEGGRGKVTVFKYIRNILVFLRRLSLKRNYLSWSKLLGFHHSLIYFEEEKYTIPAHHSHHVPYIMG